MGRRTRARVPCGSRGNSWIVPPCSLMIRRLIESQLFGVSPLDPGVLAAVVALLAAVALAACLVPARRATRVDPVAALRQE